METKTALGRCVFIQFWVLGTPKLESYPQHITKTKELSDRTSVQWEKTMGGLSVYLLAYNQSE